MALSCRRNRTRQENAYKSSPRKWEAEHANADISSSVTSSPPARAVILKKSGKYTLSTPIQKTRRFNGIVLHLYTNPRGCQGKRKGLRDNYNVHGHGVALRQRRVTTGRERRRRRYRTQEASSCSRRGVVPLLEDKAIALTCVSYELVSIRQEFFKALSFTSVLPAPSSASVPGSSACKRTRIIHKSQLFATT